MQRTSGEHDRGEYREKTKAKGRESWSKESLGEMVRPCQDGRVSTAGGLGTIPPAVDHCRGFRQIPYSSTEIAAQRTDSGRVGGNSLKAPAQVQVSNQAAQTLAAKFILPFSPEHGLTLGTNPGCRA